jgi:hypothetical protein
VNKTLHGEEEDHKAKEENVEYQLLMLLVDFDLNGGS